MVRCHNSKFVLYLSDIELIFILHPVRYKKAADQGHIISQLVMGQSYENGVGVSADFVEAVKWYTILEHALFHVSI
jgi:hypothetical protein